MIFTRADPLSFMLALLVAASVLWPAHGLRADPAAFVSVIEDLPLMAGLIEDPEAAVVFETASGRIAETVASGTGDPQEAAEYYATTLPQLGWHLESRTRYRREGEVLSIEITADDSRPGQIAIYFRLTPGGS